MGGPPTPLFLNGIGCRNLIGENAEKQFFIPLPATVTYPLPGFLSELFKNGVF